MAQAIVLLCDPHLVEDGERVEGMTITWKGKSCEMCDSCYGTYVISELDELMVKYGRKADDNGQPKREKKKPVEAAPESGHPINPIDPLACPYCGKVAETMRRRNAHIGQAHKARKKTEGA